MPPFRLARGRLLRVLEESDAQELHELIERNRPRLARWMAWAVEHQTRRQTIEFIRLTRRQLSANEGLQAALVADGRIVGMAGFLNWNLHVDALMSWLA